MLFLSIQDRISQRDLHSNVCSSLTSEHECYFLKINFVRHEVGDAKDDNRALREFKMTRLAWEQRAGSRYLHHLTFHDIQCTKRKSGYLPCQLSDCFY